MILPSFGGVLYQVVILWLSWLLGKLVHLRQYSGTYKAERTKKLLADLAAREE